MPHYTAEELEAIQQFEAWDDDRKAFNAMPNEQKFRQDFDESAFVPPFPKPEPFMSAVKKGYDRLRGTPPRMMTGPYSDAPGCPEKIDHAAREKAANAQRFAEIIARRSPGVLARGQSIIEDVLWRGQANPLVDRWRRSQNDAERSGLEVLAAWGGTEWSQARIDGWRS